MRELLLESARPTLMLMSFETLLPVVTLIAGGLLQYLSQWGTDSRQQRASRQAIEFDQARARRERRETFELEHLLKLKDALMRYGRAVGHAHFIDSMTAKTTGVYAGTQLTREASEELHVAGREVLGLMHMVLDDNLREQVEHTYELLGKLSALMRAELDVANALFVQGMGAYDQTLRQIGERVRSIHLASVE